MKSQVIKYYQGIHSYYQEKVMSILNSTYNSFSFTIFGIYEQLITLRQERLSIQMYKMIEDLNENQPGVVDDISEIFNNTFTKMIDGTEADYKIIGGWGMEHTLSLPGRLLEHMKLLKVEGDRSFCQAQRDLEQRIAN